MALISRALWPLTLLGATVNFLLFQEPKGVSIEEKTCELTDHIKGAHGRRRKKRFTACFLVFTPDNWNGQTMLFLHGFAGHPEAYLMLSRYAKDTGYRIYAMHVPSHGSTDDVSGPDASNRVVKLIAQSVTKLGMGRVLVVGHSLGAGLALCVARELARSDLVEGVVAYTPPTGSKAIERRPPPPAPTLLRLGSLVPDVIVNAGQTLAVATVKRQGGTYAQGLGTFVANPPRLVSAYDILTHADALIPVMHDLVDQGIVPQLVFALFDTAIAWWPPWFNRRNIPANIRLAWGTHASIIKGFGLDYLALLAATADAQKAQVASLPLIQEATPLPAA